MREPICLEAEVRPVPGTNLAVSAAGEVFGPRGLRRFSIDREGYANVSVRRPGRPCPDRLRIHTAVLLAWVGPAPAGMEGRHRNGDQLDNRLTNLEWATHQANIADKHAHGTMGRPGRPGQPTRVLSEADVAEMRRLWPGVSIRSLAARFGVGRDHCRRRRARQELERSLMAVSRRLRFEVLKRDNYTCRYCGAKAPDVALTVDHVIPTTLGGSDDPSNLVAACGPCNAGKSSVAPDAPLVADATSEHIRWGKAIQMAAYYWSIDRQVLDDVLGEFDKKWLSWTSNVGEEKRAMPRPLDWPISIERFYQAGIDPDALAHFVDVAMRNSRVVSADIWSYFCGCCWKHVRKLQDDAKHYIQYVPEESHGQD